MMNPVPWLQMTNMISYQGLVRTFPWYIQALRPDGSPLTFGYDVLDLQENNIGVVGQGSRLFIRVDEIPTGIKVALNDEQNLFCTITFQHVIDENKTYICQ